MATFEMLPDEILEYIFGKLPPYQDLDSLASVCKRWSTVVENVLRYKKMSLDRGLVDYNLCWKSYAVKGRPTPGMSELRCSPASRHSHSAIICDHIMWVFGGSSLNGAFNDLWCFDLSKREWFHPKSTGNYPNPKACCSLVQYQNQLILFGGWRQGTGMAHQSHILFNELHVYDLEVGRWEVKTFSYGPKPIAAHSATVHGDKMIVFGGYSGNATEGQGTTNEVWILDLKTFHWSRPKILDRRPNARYGHFQIPIDDDYLLVVGGSGGPNNMFNDAWLLQMKTDIWKWEPVTIKNKKFTASHMWCHPAAIVDKKMVVLGPTPAMPIDLKMPKQLPGNNRLLRPPAGAMAAEDLPDRNVAAVVAAAPERPERPRSVENRRPEPDLWANRGNNFNDAAVRLQRSLYIRNLDQNLPRRFNEPIIHGTIKMAAFNVDNNSQLPQAIQRERQLENLRRMEQKLQRQRLVQRREEEARKTKRAKTNCLAIFICDLSNVLTTGIEWIEYKNHGLLPDAPEKNILSTIVAGTGELIVFGGLLKDLGNESVSNNVHFLTVPQTLI